ncbi:MAG: hemolysin family protein [Gemmataceae bacterium]|nr:hemolysin family protein [Gemmataceae bacterium]
MLAAAPVAGSNWIVDVLLLLLVPALVLLNGLFVAAEFALVAVRKTRMEELSDKGISAAKSVLQALRKLDDAIAATQLGITLASIGLGMASEPALHRLFLPLFSFLPDKDAWLTAHLAAGIVSFVIITFLHVVFGELIPKTVALQMPDRTALWLAAPLLWFSRLARPAIWAMNGVGNWLLARAGFKGASSESMVHSVEELQLLIEDTEEAGFIDEEQAGLLENVFELRNKVVADCMVPREKMAALEIATPPDMVMEAVRSGAHTRMPVYEGEPDNIVGIVNTKDLFYLFSLQGVVVLLDALYPPLYLKPDETVSNALRLFKKARRPMALVRDEEGKIHGLITLEDIVEEIVGELEDEHDRPTPKIKRRRKLPPR